MVATIKRVAVFKRTKVATLNLIGSSGRLRMTVRTSIATLAQTAATIRRLVIRRIVSSSATLTGSTKRTFQSIRKVTAQIITTAIAKGRKFFLEFLVTASATITVASVGTAYQLIVAMTRILKMANRTLTVELADRIHELKLVKKIVKFIQRRS
jgi:hypothetical protein